MQSVQQGEHKLIWRIGVLQKSMSGSMILFQPQNATPEQVKLALFLASVVMLVMMVVLFSVYLPR